MPPYVSSMFSRMSVMSMGMPAREKSVSTPGIDWKTRLLAYAFHTLRAVTLMDLTPVPLGVSIGPLYSSPCFSTVACASGVMPVEKPLR
jgi:hypothetical protein